MNKKRRILTEDGSGCYHIVSRLIAGAFQMDESERELFRKIMRKVEEFCGVRIITYCIMPNHFHVLVDIPKQPALNDADFLKRIGILYGEEAAVATKKQWDEWRRLKLDALVEKAQDGIRRRIGDVSAFAATLKVRYSTAYNQRKGRRGTLWEARFKSLLVENADEARKVIAAYIDLNPVRGGIVKDPKDYRWSGYGEAVKGSDTARTELESVYLDKAKGDWKEFQARYRELLYVDGEPKRDGSGKQVKMDLSTEALKDALAKRQALPTAAALRCRVRYFTDGVAIGSKEFIENVFLAHRDNFSKGRRTGARPMRAADWGGLQTCRALQKEPVTVTDFSKPGPGKG